MSQTSLVVLPELRRFSSSQERDLLSCLADLDSAAEMTPISSVREVLLDGDGRSQADGYRFTSWAFYQLCQIVCAGLHRLIQALLMEDARHGKEVALGILTQLVQLRFSDRLYGKKILRDRRRRLVEGIVGPGYCWLSNHSLYERLSGLSKDLGARFLGATLDGRWLALRYYFHPAYVTVDTDRLYRGYHVSNHEVGASSVRAASVLIRSTGQTAAMTAITAAGRVRHQGRRFSAKLAGLLSSVAGLLSPAETYREAVTTARASRLGLAGGNDVRERRLDELSAILVNAGLSPSLARRVVTGAVVLGSVAPASPPPALAAMSPAVLEERSVFDLYNALGREAKALPIGQRERVEQVAYDLLVGKLEFTPGPKERGKDHDRQDEATPQP